MDNQYLIDVCIKTFSQHIGVSVGSIQLLSAVHGFRPTGPPPGPGQVSTGDIISVIKCTVSIPGANYLITFPISGKGNVEWIQI